MFRALFFTLLSALLIHAQALNDEYTLLAGIVSKNKDHILANKDVIIYSKNYGFRADRAVYNHTNGDLELFGNVDIMIENKVLTRVNHTIFNIKSKTFKGKNLFAYDEDSQMWFRSKSTHSKKDLYILKNTTLSSCNAKDPDWHITFSKGVYHKDKEYISIYNPTFYAGNVPILYLPWFGFTTNKNRSTGFLKPIVGFENSENLFFVLPYYIANAQNWDLELDPQIRLNRGAGVYSTFRFVDTPHSKGDVNFGIFKDKKSYYEKNNLENRTHYGVALNYENRALLSEALKNHHYSDGLLVDITYLNDIDYINLDHKNDWASSKLVTSRANYVFYRDYDFLGLYAKYFIDTEKKSNADTLQTLPSIQYHRFSQGIKIPNLLYSLDYKFKNNYRKEGLNARQHELSIPLTFHKSLFGDLLNFQASENFYYSRVNYSEGNSSTVNADYFSNYHKITLASDLTKKYPTFIHNLQLDISLIIPSFVHKKGYFADFLPFNLETKSLAFKLNQYYYGADGFNFLTHRLRQVYYDDNTLYKYGDLENQVIYKISPNFVIDNTFFYSYEYDRIHKLQTGVRYKNSSLDMHLNHTYEYKVRDKNTNFITTRVSQKIDTNYDLFGSLDYDLEDRFTREWTLGWRMKKRCWDYRFRYKESVTPSLTSAGAESIIKRGVLLFVRFSPFGGMEYAINQQKSLESVNTEKDYDEK